MAARLLGFADWTIFEERIYNKGLKYKCHAKDLCKLQGLVH
jgi:hypothetical protein